MEVTVVCARACTAHPASTIAIIMRTANRSFIMIAFPLRAPINALQRTLSFCLSSRDERQSAQFQPADCILLIEERATRDFLQAAA